MAGVALSPADAGLISAPAMHLSVKQVQPKVNGKSSSVGLAPIAEFDPLVPDSDFGAPVPVTQTQYIVSGPAGLKPLQVYNDAQNTHIALADQLDRPSVLVPARGGLHPHQSWVRGNQMLVRGVPAEIVLAYPDGRFVSISRLGDAGRLAANERGSASVSSATVSGPDAQSAQQWRQQVEQQQQQQQQMAMLQQELRFAQIRIQELQQQHLEEQTQKIRAQANVQEAVAQKSEAFSQLQELQLRLARTQNVAEATQTQSAAQSVGPAASPTAVPLADASGWILQAGETVSSALSRWATASGRRLVWSPKMDVPVRRPKVYHGSLESALQQLAHDLNKTLPVLVQIEPQLILVGIAP